MRCLGLFSTMILLGGLASGQAPAAHAQVAVALEFRDESGALLPVRAGVFHRGAVGPPVDPAAHLYQWQDDQSFFYCNGTATVIVPADEVTIHAGRGFEYLPKDTTLVVTAPTTVTLTLTRFVDMNALGAYSGDTHVHISHPPLVYTLGADDLLLAARAEDLNFINSMEEQEFFTGVIDPVSEPLRVISFSKEQRNAHFSHLSVLGLKQWIVDQGCTQEGVACGRTLDASIHDQVHAQAGEVAVIATHPTATLDPHDLSPWPGGGMWRAMAIDLPAGAVDAMDILAYRNAGPAVTSQAYFRALDAGFRLPPSAGTDCTLGSGESGPAGGYRAYVFTGAPFTVDAWIAGLKAGRSFVTNYPLFTRFDVEGATPGDVLHHDGPTLHGSVSVACALPVDRIEIISDAGVVHVLEPPGGPARHITASFTIERTDITWVVARAVGYESSWHAVWADGLFAQTAPVWIEPETMGPPGQVRVHGSSAARNAAGHYFLAQLEEMEQVFDEDGYFPDQSRTAFDEAVGAARRHFTGLITDATGVDSRPPSGVWRLRGAWPNPFVHDVRVAYAVPPAGGGHAVAVYDAAGRLVRHLFSGTLPAGDHVVAWDGRDAGGGRAASGVYFVRITPRSGVSLSQKLVLVR